MDESEDIFGEDVRDSSYLQIVSSDEEDLYLTKSPDKPNCKTNFPSNTSSTKSNYYEEKFDRQFRLDKTLESDVNSDTQNIINEINRIFEKSEAQEEHKTEQNNENIIQKGKKLINKIKSRLSSISDGFLTPKPDDLKIPKQKKRTRANTRVNYTEFFESEDHSNSSSSSESITKDDEEFDPYMYLGTTKKKPKKNRKNKNVNSTNKLNRNKKSILESILNDSYKDKPFDKYGFNNSDLDAYSPLEDDQEQSDKPSDMFCLKFVIMDQNKNLINDNRLESVYIKNTETLGNIAKKIGEMYNINQEDFGRIKIIIDGESQDHSLEIGNPELNVEDNMQIDIKFPSKEDHSKINLKKAKVNKVKKRYKPRYSRPRLSLYTHSYNNPEFIEID